MKILCAACEVDFEHKNYTILTSQCKGPQYPPKVCCDAFKQFACPFTNEINDMTTDCASVMFSYINIYGKYPPGLFANECKEGSQGLDCSQVKPEDRNSKTSNTFHVAAPPFMKFITTVAFLGLLFNLFWRMGIWKIEEPLVLIVSIFLSILSKHFGWQPPPIHMMLEFICYDQDCPDKYIIIQFLSF